MAPANAAPSILHPTLVLVTRRATVSPWPCSRLGFCVNDMSFRLDLHPYPYALASIDMSYALIQQGIPRINAQLLLTPSWFLQRLWLPSNRLVRANFELTSAFSFTFSFEIRT